MKYVGSFVALCCLHLAGTAAQDDPAKKDFDSLQGVWQCVSLEAKGEPPGKDFKVTDIKLTFKGDKLTFAFGPAEKVHLRRPLALPLELEKETK